MLKNLEIKCKNIMTLIPTNLYIHSMESHETTTLSRLEIPEFLMHYLDDSIQRIMTEKENLAEEELTDNQVYLYIDPFKMCYLTWPIPTGTGKLYTITLGPLITEHLTVEEIRYMGYKMKLSSDNVFVLESFYGIVPYFDQVQMARIASLFLDYLAVDTHMPQIIREDHSLMLPEETKYIDNKFQSFDFVEQNYANEAKMLHAIEHGDIAYVDRMMAQMTQALTIPPRFPSDPLREQKNLSITLNSISLRAALKGGLNQSIAHSLSHNFAILIEQQTSPEAIGALNVRIMRTYTESVNKYALKNHSQTIIDAVNYIRIHFTDKIALKDVSDHLHLSREHLSRQFKEEMDMTITDFIHKTKVEESCSLLTSKVYSVSNIAYTFGYSSPAHYTKMFKQYMGMSPKQWQKQHHENNHPPVSSQ